MRFCYHPDNLIYNDFGKVSTYTEFMLTHPDFPLVEGQYFDYKDGLYNSINNEGHNVLQEAPQDLIMAINNLGV